MYACMRVCARVRARGRTDGWIDVYLPKVKASGTLLISASFVNHPSKTGTDIFKLNVPICFFFF